MSTGGIAHTNLKGRRRGHTGCNPRKIEMFLEQKFEHSEQSNNIHQYAKTDKE